MDSAKYRSVEMKQEEWYAFLKAPRFWVMLAGIISIYLEKKGVLGEDEMMMIASISSLFVAIKTFDRSMDRIAKS